MNVGKISGGTSVNVIASEASLDLDLRSEGQDALVRIDLSGGKVHPKCEQDGG